MNPELQDGALSALITLAIIASPLLIALWNSQMTHKRLTKRIHYLTHPMSDKRNRGF